MTTKFAEVLTYFIAVSKGETDAVVPDINELLGRSDEWTRDDEMVGAAWSIAVDMERMHWALKHVPGTRKRSRSTTNAIEESAATLRALICDIARGAALMMYDNATEHALPVFRLLSKALAAGEARVSLRFWLMYDEWDRGTSLIYSARVSGQKTQADGRAKNHARDAVIANDMRKWQIKRTVSMADAARRVAKDHPVGARTVLRIAERLGVAWHST